jgi:hypothetical protein
MAKLSFLEFFAKWNNQNTDVDGAFGFQCMDLLHRYHMECLDLTDRTILAAPTARDVYQRAPLGVKGGNLFQKIPNLWWTVPKQGDIVFWGAPFGGKYIDDKGKEQYNGHVAIINEANMRRFTSFDQNFGADKKCRLVEHSYSGVMGFLRFKGK